MFFASCVNVSPSYRVSFETTNRPRGRSRLRDDVDPFHVHVPPLFGGVSLTRGENVRVSAATVRRGRHRTRTIGRATSSPRVIDAYVVTARPRVFSRRTAFGTRGDGVFAVKRKHDGRTGRDFYRPGPRAVLPPRRPLTAAAAAADFRRSEFSAQTLSRQTPGDSTGSQCACDGATIRISVTEIATAGAGARTRDETARARRDTILLRRVDVSCVNGWSRVYPS